MVSKNWQWPIRVRELLALAQSTSPVLGATILGSLTLGSVVSAPQSAETDWAAYLGIVLIASLRSFFYFLALGTIVKWLVRHLPKLGWLLHGVLYASSEALRAVLIGLAGVEQGLIESLELEYRLVAGGITGLTLLGLGAVLLNDSRAFRSQRAKLEETRAEILHTSQLFKDELQQKRLETVAEIRRLIETALKTAVIEASSKTDQDGREFAVQQLVRLSNDAIRPLSHELRMSYPKLSPPITEPQKVKINLRLLLDKATVANPIRPWILGSLGFMLMIGAILTSANPLLNFIVMLGVIGWQLGISEVLRRVLLPHIRRQNSLVTRILLLSGAFLIVTANPLLGGLAFGQVGRGYGLLAFVYILILGMTIQWLIAMYAGLTAIREENLSRLEESNEKLRWLKARSVAKLWAAQQNLAKTIHRDVQGQLIAEAMKLQQNLKGGADITAALEQTQTSLLEVMERVGESDTPLSLRDQIRDLNHTWVGVFELELNAPEELIEKLTRDPETNQILNDFVAEFALNSVKHGEARHGRLTVEQTRPDVIRISVWNDGKPFDSQITKGMGLELFSRQAMNFWHSGPGVQGALITAELAFAVDGADKL